MKISCRDRREEKINKGKLLIFPISANVDCYCLSKESHKEYLRNFTNYFNA